MVDCEIVDGWLWDGRLIDVVVDHISQILYNIIGYSTSSSSNNTSTFDRLNSINNLSLIYMGVEGCDIIVKLGWDFGRWWWLMIVDDDCEMILSFYQPSSLLWSHSWFEYELWNRIKVREMRYWLMVKLIFFISLTIHHHLIINPPSPFHLY